MRPHPSNTLAFPRVYPYKPRTFPIISMVKLSNAEVPPAGGFDATPAQREAAQRQVDSDSQVYSGTSRVAQEFRRLAAEKGLPTAENVQ
ncbi:hypothetical protein HYZ99_03720 [Candidatus Peregrinibacteria bacterium]|nr:hypothetical protein [Candidatus Peregrinibacteria bacterium]